MKKLWLLFTAAVLLTACASVDETENLANCKFALRSVELTNYNLTSFDFDVIIAITNMNRKQAASLKRFEGELTVNEDKMADVTLDEMKIEPNATKNAKAQLNVPMTAFNSKLLGLINGREEHSVVLDWGLAERDSVQKEKKGRKIP